ncbi:porin [Azospirillum sp. SYSU D00513]|uniref:porin n=1 Tax=Azospirillum sp. SYSU D00513 TaxID=2812561 RepID=UPI001A970BFB|nr:porin [Azospirillum sp. SYSU D00513]
MNRYLLAGCAAVALTLGAGAANAQAKFEVKVGGDYYFEAGYVDDEPDAGRNVEFRNRFRLVVTPQAKADNGLEYGARVRIRAMANGGVDHDRAFMFVQGGFGQVQLGTVNSYNDQTGVSRPISWQPLGNWDFANAWATGTGGNLGPNALSNGSGISWPLMNPDGVGSKIVYISPRFAGFQAGASYTPRSSSRGTDINRDNTTGGYNDLYEVGANYVNSFGGVEVKGSAGYFWGDAPVAGLESLNAWQAGAQVGYAGFAVGGSYLSFGDSGSVAGSEDAYNWTVGAEYKAGPLVVGVGYTYGEEDAGAVAGETQVQFWDVGVGYTVAPGLTVQAQYTYFETDQPAGVVENDGNIFLLRSILAF